ncbi:disulfide oxidoreductase [Sediminibacillus albus]|uniref:Probable disulfide formation protein n=1 Tax=Sediminibacillus albus TaxID=407036 RepID=A0A1G8XES8_9BACI|nr:disulfide oxidoreductase [Sediminibacillus albus]SDJ88455.1 disulfide bond formation protein DsbB [Sediminibacillus albus]
MAVSQQTKETILLIIWGQALTAMLGSLFFSEFMGYTPCELCWYQRILMYPLVIIYGYAAVKKDIRLALPGLIMSGLGIGVSTYHYLIQKLPALHDAGAACGLVPCNGQYINYFGFVTIPLLALVAFLVIFILHISLLVQQRRD